VGRLSPFLKYIDGISFASSSSSSSSSRKEEEELLPLPKKVSNISSFLFGLSFESGEIKAVGIHSCFVRHHLHTSLCSVCRK
jgi:hypothetical protein